MRRLCLTLSAILFLLTLNANCIGQFSSSPLDIQSFSVNPSEINLGEPATLSWKVSGATSIVIDQNIGQVNAAGTITVNPQATTTYKLTAKNTLSSSSSTQTLVVKTAPAASGSTNTIRTDLKPGYLGSKVSSAVKPKIESFMASPLNIWKGDSASLFWVVKDAKSVSIDNGIGTVAATGTKIVKPGADTKYTVTATNDFGTSTKEITIDVKTKAVDINVVGGSTSQVDKKQEIVAPVIVDYTVAPEYSFRGEAVNVFWNVTGADSIALKAMCMNPYTMKQYANLPVYNNLPASSSMSVSMNMPIWDTSYGISTGTTQQWVYLRLSATNSAGVTERDVAVLAEITR